MNRVYLVVIAYKYGGRVIDRVYNKKSDAEAYCDQFRESFRNDADSGIDFVFVSQPYVVC